MISSTREISSPNILRNYAVRHERHDLGGDDFAEVWRKAQRRRSEDIYFLFTHVFRKRWRFKSPNRYGRLLRSFTHNSEPFLLSVTEQAALQGDGSEGG